MRRGMNGLALQVQRVLQHDPHAGDLYVFRRLRGDLIKTVWHDGLGSGRHPTHDFRYPSRCHVRCSYLAYAKNTHLRCFR